MERLGDDLRHGLARVEGAVGILEDHLESAPQPRQALGGLGEEALAREDHLAGRRTVERHDKPRQSRFAAAALAHDAQGRAFIDGEVEAVDGLENRYACRAGGNDAPGFAPRADARS